MSIFDVLNAVGGLCLFLFGMNVMGQALERRAGEKLRSTLGKLTTNKAVGFATGLGITAVIQSSSAATVMVVGFVNSGLISLKQAINVIMGANVGTTVTAWILSLSGISSDNLLVSLLKPSSFTPILALVGIILNMFCKSSKKQDTGMILLGFATLMFGMEAMSGAVSGLSSVPAFVNLFTMFTNPILGVLAGAVLTAIIQSSSASVGILQALAATGSVSYGAAIPIIMGQNIGTCVTAMLSSIGANRNAKRAALVHLSFNVIGTTVCLTVFYIIKIIFAPALLNMPSDSLGIAMAHSAFNIICTIIMLPASGLLEILVNKLVSDGSEQKVQSELDERLLATPSIALERCNEVAADLAVASTAALNSGISSLNECSQALADSVIEKEALSDHYEDILGTYLVHLSTKHLSISDNAQIAKLLKVIGDFERIADHGLNLLKASQELKAKNMSLTDSAYSEYNIISSAVREILEITVLAFINNDIKAAESVEPLRQAICMLKEKMRTSHIMRLQNGSCSIGVGFIWSDILTNLERTADHCSNIAGCIIDIAENSMNLHESLRNYRNYSAEFNNKFNDYLNKYSLPVSHD